MKLQQLKFISRFFILLLFLIIASSCTSDSTEDENETNDENQGVITATVNGSNFKSPNSTADIPGIESLIIASISRSSDSYFMLITGLNVDFENSEPFFNKIITISVIDDDYSSLRAGKTFGRVPNEAVNGEALLKGASGVYVECMFGATECTMGIAEHQEEIQEVFVKITDFDPEKKRISGEFNFKGIDIDVEPNTTYTITEGVFTDIPFELNDI